MGPHEPYWRTNTSFSPPPPRWDFRLQPEGQSFGSQEGSQLYGSSTSSNSSGSRSWLRGSYLPNNRHPAPDGFGPYLSSPSDFFPAQHWTPPIIQEISVDEYRNSTRRVLRPLSFSPSTEGISARQDSRRSISSVSDSSDYDTIAKSQSSNRNFTSRHCFMSKPVHPLAFPSERNHPESRDFDDTVHRRDSDVDFTNVSEPNESDPLNRPSLNQSNTFKCGLCERFLSQRSPVSRSGDFPVTGVLSCHHVFHAECLDQTTKTHKNDPSCPICSKSEENSNSPDQRAFPKSRIPHGPSRAWTCGQAGNCVEGALCAPPRNAMLLLNRNRIKKSLSLKGHSGDSGKEFSGKPKRSGMCSSIGSGGSGGVGSSKSAGKKS